MRHVIASSALLATALLAGCVVAPVPGPRYYGGGPVVRVAPPPPQVEVYGPAPYAGAVWINGYWNWTGSRHAWVGGRWEQPRPGYRWEPQRWDRDGDGWRDRPGRWERYDDRGGRDGGDRGRGGRR